MVKPHVSLPSAVPDRLPGAILAPRPAEHRSHPVRSRRAAKRPPAPIATAGWRWAPGTQPHHL